MIIFCFQRNVCPDATVNMVPVNVPMNASVFWDGKDRTAVSVFGIQNVSTVTATNLASVFAKKAGEVFTAIKVRIIIIQLLKLIFLTRFFFLQ